MFFKLFFRVFFNVSILIDDSRDSGLEQRSGASAEELSFRLRRLPELAVVDVKNRFFAVKLFEYRHIERNHVRPQLLLSNSCILRWFGRQNLVELLSSFADLGQMTFPFAQENWDAFVVKVPVDELQLVQLARCEEF